MTVTQNAPRTARERARAELTREIKEGARRQLAATGANGISLRAVARELGMASSALYRYFPSRDDLLTALIIDAYDAIGEAAEQAIADGKPDESWGRDRWLAACHAIRGWALAHPHEYALIYGSPVPGYRAPEATIGPAARVPLAFAGVLVAATEAGELGDDAGAHAGPDAAADALTGGLADQAAALSAALASPVAPDALVRAVIAWTQLFGMISWELFGQFVGSFEPADALFAHAADQLATFVGFPL
jgi:AcrR family transcriptional regulator